MKTVYPVYLSEIEDGKYLVNIPDFHSCTEGNDLADAIYMGRDAIGSLGITYEDEKMEIPAPFSSEYVPEQNEFRTLIDVNFEAYRLALDTRLVKKNCTIPYYLEEAAKKAGINFSSVLTEALASRLDLPLRA